MNIIIRQAEPGDAEAVLRCLTGPKAVHNTLQLPYRTVESVREFLAKSEAGNYQLVAEVDGEVVGNIGLTVSTRPRINHIGVLGMMVRDDWQGKGIGTALMWAMVDLADKWLNLVRLELSVYTDNEPALALYRKFGFEIEGTQRKAGFRASEFVDVYTMARVK